ncbi:SDR family oxidoreductase [Puerhibacterium sp. TATVAM-FAB25]|uniref:SDR family oxidoreductase n=1 Tax=Puerhibacterium sp. TATVAM-FAB25 TaxID=3093699 RepID=UPI00397C8537
MMLVVGASGNLGRETVRLALAGGHAVRAAARRPDALAHLRAHGVDVVQMDLTDPRSIARACQGVEAVVAAAHSLLGSGANRSPRVDGDGNRMLTDAAREAGVQHMVFLSTVGASPTADVEFLRTKHAAEEHVRASGMRYTILRPTAFMEAHARQYIGTPLLTRGRVTIPGSGRSPINLIAAADAARYVLIGLTDPRARDRVLEIGGWDNVTKDEIARTYARKAGISPRVRHLPRGLLRAGSVALGPVKPEVADALRLLLWVDGSDQTLDPTALQHEFPFDMVRLEGFVQRDVEAFRERMPA